MSNERIQVADDSVEPQRTKAIGVYEIGYEWVRAKYRLKADDWVYGMKPRRWTTGLVLTERRGSGRRRVYNPLRIPDLFRTFAATKTDPDSILSFATQYGELGASVEVRADKTNDWWPRVVSESPERWKAEILEMRDAVRIWDAFESGDDAALRLVVARWDELDPKWRKRVKGAIQRGERAYGIRQEYVPSDWYHAEFDEGGNLAGYIEYDHLKLIEHTDTFRELRRVALSRGQAARAVLAEAANRNLRRYCTVELEERERLVAEYKVGVQPQCLLGALWWQFSRLVVGTAAHRPCKTCGRPIEISTGEFGARTNREFCTDACKLKDHRRKVQEAKRMKSEGNSVRQIAKHFETETSVIENWLTKRK